ncbi:MAG: extracellular solute-binding protein [Lachnospiraceae bacterium]
MRFKRCMTVCLCAVVLQTGLLGCGEKKETTAPQKEMVTLSLWGAEEDQQLLQKMVDSFKKQYKDQADFQITISEEGEATCKETVLFDPKAAADVYTFADDQFRDLMENHALLEVTEDKEQIIEENGGKDSAAIAAASRDGKLYAYPATSSNGYFLFYNSSYYKKEDVKTMDQLLNIAAKNKKKVSMDFSSGWYTYSFFKGAGMDATLSEDGIVTECDFNRTEGKYKGADVAQAMLDIASSEGFVSLDDQKFQDALKKGEVIAGISGTWNTESVKESFGKGYAAEKLPTFTIAGDQVQMHSVAGFKLIGVNAYTKNPKWAQKLAEWITNEKNQKLRFSMRGEAPSNVVAAADPKVQQDPAIAALGKQAEFAHIQTVSHSYWTPTYKFGIIMAAGNPDGKDLQALVDEMTEGIKAVPEEEK